MVVDAAGDADGGGMESGKGITGIRTGAGSIAGCLEIMESSDNGTVNDLTAKESFLRRPRSQQTASNVIKGMLFSSQIQHAQA